MIRNGEFYMIHEMKKRGMSISQIANELGRDRKTIRKWLQQSEPAYYQRHVKRPSKLDPFKDYIRRRMEEGCLNANVIFDEIKAQGYTGRKTILRSFMQPLRPSVLSKATVRFETSRLSSPSRLGPVPGGWERGAEAAVCVRHGVRLLPHDVRRIHGGRKTRNAHGLSSAGVRILRRSSGSRSVRQYENRGRGL